MKKVEMYKLTKAQSGVNSVLVKQTGENPYHLHSTVDPVQEAAEWLSHIQVEDNTAYVVLGCGLGYHVRALLDKIPQNSILILILTKQEYNFAAQEKAKGPLYNLHNTRFFVYEAFELYNLAVHIAQHMFDFDIKKIKICNYYPAMRLDADVYASCEKNLADLVGEKMTLSVNLAISTGTLFMENYWRNIPYIATNPGITDFENIFKGWPCIVVSAGPSLNKNINILKDCLPYAVVIASGSTIGALHKHGIVPHFLVVTDATPAMFDDLDGCFNEHTVLVASIEVHHKVVSMYPGRRCFAYTIEDDRNVFKDYLPSTMRLRQTSTVATVAVDFAKHCGAEQIIMVGQDLAFNKDSFHADGVKAGGLADLDRMEVSGYYGGMVNTISSFKTTIEYLEAYVRLTSNIRFINATEGGAHIAGMEQLSLVEVKNAFLGTMLPIDDKINGIFKEFGAMPSKLDVLINEMVQCQLRCCDVVQRLENYNKEHPNFKMKIEDNDANADIINTNTQNLREFFQEIANHDFAPSYKMFLKARMQLAEFYKQDGSNSLFMYALYVEIFRQFEEVVNKLYQWINENINSLEKISK